MVRKETGYRKLLREAIKLYNQRRKVLREFYELRKLGPASCLGHRGHSGVGGRHWACPAAEHIELVKKFIAEAKGRPKPKAQKAHASSSWGN